MEILLFEIGGVAIDIGLDPTLDHWQPHTNLSPAALRRRLRSDEPYRRHERGEIDAGAYLRHLAEVFEIRADASAVAAGRLRDGAG